MDTRAHLARLQQLTGRLTPSPDAPDDELGRFERTLAKHLRDNADLTIRGNRLPHEGADALDEATDAFAERIRNLESEFARQPAGHSSGRFAADLQTRDGVPIESARQLGARVGNGDGAVSQLRPFP